MVRTQLIMMNDQAGSRVRAWLKMSNCENTFNFFNLKVWEM